MNYRYLKWILLTLTVLTSFVSFANRYIYIQGDKQVPFVVAVEGYNLPKLGTHYCIIPNLEPGIANISITFQSSEYPVHKFRVKVPEHSSRGLILTKVSKNTYALFDMQTQAYISNNNTEDDAYLAFNPENFNSLVRKSISNTPSQQVNISERSKTPPMPTLVKPEKTSDKNKNKKTEFLEDLDLNSSRRYSGKNNNESDKTPSSVDPSSTYQSEYKGNCSAASSNEEFEDFSAAYVNQKDDTEKLKYIRKNKSKICLNTSQILILSNFLNGQSSKYELFHLLKNDVTDRDNFHKLQNVFNTDFMKEKFLNMIK